MATGEEKTVGRAVLDRRIFCGDSRENQNETVIQEYVKNQGNKEDKVVKYKQLYLDI